MLGKRKRIVLTVENKLEIIKRREEGESVSSLATEFGIGQQTVRDILKNQPKIDKFISKCDTFSCALQKKSLKGAANKQLEDLMIKWFIQQRAEGSPISGPLILNKAKYFFEKLDMPGTFKFSSGWLTRFKERHGIKELSEKPSTDNNVDATLAILIKEMGLVQSQIYCVDETELYWRAMPTCKQENKDRITIMSCTNSSGEDKLKLVVVGKSNIKGRINFPVDYYYNHKSARMTKDIFEDWWKNKFVPHVKTYLSQKGLPHKAILLVNNALCRHSLTKNGDIVAINFPPKLTFPQPTVIETTKRLYKKILMLDFIAEAKNPILFSNSITIKDAIYNISIAWKEVKSETIKESFKTILPNAENNNLQVENLNNNIKIELYYLKLIENIEGCENLKEENINEWLNIYKNENMADTDDDLVQSVQQPRIAGPSVSFQEADDEDLEPPCKKINCNEALKAAKTLLQFVENQDDDVDVDYIEILQIRGRIKKIKQKIILQRGEKITNVLSK